MVYMVPDKVRRTSQPYPPYRSPIAFFFLPVTSSIFPVLAVSRARHQTEDIHDNDKGGIREKNKTKQFFSSPNSNLSNAFCWRV